MSGYLLARHASAGWHPCKLVTFNGADELPWTPAFVGVTEEVARA